MTQPPLPWHLCCSRALTALAWLWCRRDAEGNLPLAYSFVAQADPSLPYVTLGFNQPSRTLKVGKAAFAHAHSQPYARKRVT
jgi:hypothetical protein